MILFRGLRFTVRFTTTGSAEHAFSEKALLIDKTDRLTSRAYPGLASIVSEGTLERYLVATVFSNPANETHDKLYANLLSILNTDISPTGTGQQVAISTQSVGSDNRLYILATAKELSGFGEAVKTHEAELGIFALDHTRLIDLRPDARTLYSARLKKAESALRALEHKLTDVKKRVADAKDAKNKLNVNITDQYTRLSAEEKVLADNRTSFAQ
jgi:hypothetical protein